MRKLMLLLSISALAAATLSCNKEPDPYSGPNEKTGDVKVAIAPESSFIVITSGSKASDPVPSKDQFGLKIKNAEGAEVKGWNSYADVPDIVTIPSGNYTVESNNGVLMPAAFEAPYYYGKADFKVEISKLTEVSVTCMLANVKVTVACTPEFLAAVRDVTTSIDNGTSETLGFTPEETRAGYFSVPTNGKLEVTVQGIRIIDGASVSETMYISQVAARQWHKITVNYSTTGSTSQGIVIDATTEDKDVDVNIPDSDGVINGGDNNGNWGDPDPTPDPDPDPTPDPDPVVVPTIVGSGFDIDQPLVLTNAQVGTSPVVDVNLTAVNGGIQNLFVSINSPSLPPEVLESLGIPETFDLANLTPGSDLEATLKMVGLLGEDPLKGQTSYKFSVGAFMEMFEAPKDHQFVIRVVDGAGAEVTKTLLIRRVE